MPLTEHDADLTWLDGRSASQRTAAAMDQQLEQMATACNTNGVKDAR